MEKFTKRGYLSTVLLSAGDLPRFQARQNKNIRIDKNLLFL
jgi:hypothetical protein